MTSLNGMSPSTPRAPGTGSSRRRSFLAALLVGFAALALGACGGDATTPTDAAGGTLSIEQALAAGGGPLTVKGYVVAPEGESVRLCSALLESYPPQCGDPSLVVEGLDLAAVDGLIQTAEPDLAQVSWTDTEVAVTGELGNGVLTVAPAAG